MNQFTIEESTGDEDEFVRESLIHYNESKAPFTQDPPLIFINRVIKETSGEVVAGIISKLYAWNCLFIDILWVKEEHRGKGYGAALLVEVESIVKKKGCKLIHLETFDFQAKDFYLKYGFEVFGQLDISPTSYKQYYMKKNLF